MRTGKNDNGIGERAYAEINDLIARKGMKVGDFCRLHGFTKQTLYHWQVGGCPSVYCLQRLDALGLDVHYILSGRRG